MSTTILSVILLLISGVNSRYLQCPKSNGKFSVENSHCKSYYECENWKVIKEKTCPDGQNFNPSLQWCDYEELYYCAEKEIEKYKHCKKPSGKFSKKNSHCRGYYKCEKWKVTGEFTCPHGQNFNPEKQWCDWEELYPCLEDKLSKDCPKPNGFFPKLGSQCKSYYECIKGKAYELQCPDDLVFDSVHSQCEWPEIYSCDEMKESTTVETTRTTYITTQPTSSTEGTSRTTYTTTQPTSPTEGTSRTIFTTTQPTSSTEETSFRTESKQTKTTQEYYTRTSTESTKSTAETSVTTDSVPTNEISQSTKTERTVGTTSTTDRTSQSTETKITDKYTLSSTEAPSTTRTKGTSEYNATMKTQETSTAYTSPLSTEGSSFRTETSQTRYATSSPSTAQTKPMTDTFSTASIQTDSPGEIVCPRANGLFPHPTDKTKFLSCFEFIPTVMNCPDDLIFDPTYKVCTWRKRIRI